MYVATVDNLCYCIQLKIKCIVTVLSLSQLIDKHISVHISHQ